MDKRGVELTLNVVIIAAILLITLAVLISFYLGQTKKVETAFDSCESKRGTCKFSTPADCISNKGTPLPFSCGEENKNTCCYLIP